LPIANGINGRRGGDLVAIMSAMMCSTISRQQSGSGYGEEMAAHFFPPPSF